MRNNWPSSVFFSSLSTLRPSAVLLLGSSSSSWQRDDSRYSLLTTPPLSPPRTHTHYHHHRERPSHSHIQTTFPALTPGVAALINFKQLVSLSGLLLSWDRPLAAAQSYGTLSKNTISFLPPNSSSGSTPPLPTPPPAPSHCCICHQCNDSSSE